MRLGLLPVLALFLCTSVLAAEIDASPYAYDLYERLGVSKTASLKEIKDSYRLLAKKYHPQNLGKESDEFAFVTQAYKVLKDPSKREAYEQNGLDAFPDLRVTWEAKTGKRAPRGSSSSSSSSSSPDFSSHFDRKSYEEERADRIKFTDVLYRYFKARHDGLSKNTDEETQGLLSTVFNRKYDIEDMRRNPRFGEMMKLIYNDPVWKTASPQLLSDFISGSWLYSLRYEEQELGSFLGKFDPNHPAIRSLVYDLKFPNGALTKDFESKIKRQGKIGMIIAHMLREAPYRGTPAGEKLLKHVYQMWTDLGYDRFGKIDRDEITPKLLSLLDLPEWRNNRTLARIAKTPPERRLYREAFDEYEVLRKKYPDVFPPQAPSRPAPAEPVRSSSEFGRRPKGGGNQKAYEEAYRLATTPISEGGFHMQPIFAHEWASIMSQRHNPQSFSEWSNRYWMALDFALDRGDEETAAASFAWHQADFSRTEELAAFVSDQKHKNESQPEYAFGDRFRKQFQTSQTENRPSSGEASSAEAPASASASASAPKPDPTAECMKSVLNVFFDPFGFYKR